MVSRVFTATLMLCLWLCPGMSQGQSERSVEELYAELDSLFENEEIPGDLLVWVDSLLRLDSIKYSSLNIKLGYVSNITSGGRQFGFDQFGFTPGLAYYHYSGLFSNYTVYWSSQYEPGYYLSAVGLGYMKRFSDRWVASLAHNFYFFNDSLDDHSFTKSIQFTTYFQHKWADVGFDYSYLYGNQEAHRLTLNANGRIRLKPSKGVIDAITIMPGASMQWGNANVYHLRQPRTAITDLNYIVKSNNYPRLAFRDYQKMVYFLENDRPLAAGKYLKERGFTNEQVRNTIVLYNEGAVWEENTFGFMNYAFSLPVSISAGKWNALFNYTYNIPVPLPGEDYQYDTNGYFSATLSYLLMWSK